MTTPIDHSTRANGYVYRVISASTSVDSAICIDGRTSLSTSGPTRQGMIKHHHSYNPSSIHTHTVHSRDHYTKYSSQLTIHTTIGRPDSTAIQSAAQRLTALINTIARLEVLHLVLESTTTKLLSSHIDDPVLHSTHPITHALRSILASSSADVVRVELTDVWFAPGVIEALLQDFGGGLEVSTSAPGGSFERARTGRYSSTHLWAFDLEEREFAQVEALRSEHLCVEHAGLPGSVFSELDAFCPMEYLHEDSEAMEDTARLIREVSGFFEMDGEDLRQHGEVQHTTYSQSHVPECEELDKSDDVDEEDMQGIEDINAIMGNLEEQEVQMGDECYLRYMTNFAPELLGNWLEETV